MTLKNSLSENNNENKTQAKMPSNSALSLWQLTMKSVKRHIWLPLLALLGFVLALPVSSTLAINNFASWNFDDETERQLEYFRDWAGDLMVLWQMFSACIIVVGAILSILVMFRYLHVRAQVDFYHSLPVRREQFFASNVLAAFLVFLVPYLLASLLNLLVLAISGWVAYVDMGLYLQFILFNILVYVLFLGCGCLAMQLSGTMPSALKILVLMFGLAPLLAGMYEMLGSVFFDTWVSMFSGTSILLLKASVVERYFMVSAMARGYWWYDGDISQAICWQDWLAAVLLAAAMLAISLVLYKRRSSEVAGSTLAFGWQKPLYKYPLVLCSGLMLGVFFYLMGDRSIIWMYFGAVLGTMFMALLLEVFIKNDFKAVKKGWRTAALASVAVCLLLSVYAFDLVGFDQRRPASEKVDTIYVFNSSFLDLSSDYYSYGYDEDYFLDGYWKLNRLAWLGRSYLKFSEPENVAALLTLTNGEQNRYTSWEYDNSDMSTSVYLSIAYNLKNGSVQARSYWHRLDIESYQQALETLIGSDEWRQQLGINNLDIEHTVACSLNSYQLGQEDYMYLEDSPLGAEWHKQLLQTMRSEYAELSMEELLYSSPVGMLELGEYKERTYDPIGDYYDYKGMRRFSIWIYPSMTETIAMLNQATNGLLNVNVDLSNVVELREYRKLTYDEEAELREKATYTSDEIFDERKLIATYKPETDAAVIEQILQNTVTSSAYSHSLIWNDGIYNNYYELIYKPGAEYSEDSGDVDTVTSAILYTEPSRELFMQLTKK